MTHEKGGAQGHLDIGSRVRKAPRERKENKQTNLENGRPSDVVSEEDWEVLAGDDAQEGKHSHASVLELGLSELLEALLVGGAESDRIKVSEGA